MKMPIWVIVCSVLLASPKVHAGEEMARQPRPGERIETTIVGDEEIKKLLVGRWVHEDKISEMYDEKQTYAFAKDGSYEMNRASRIHSRKEDDLPPVN